MFPVPVRRYFTRARRISPSEGATRPCRICPITRRRALRADVPAPAHSHRALLGYDPLVPRTLSHSAAAFVLSSAIAAGLSLAATRLAEAQPAAATVTPASTAAAPRNATPTLEGPMSGDQVIQVLDQTIDWYRTLGLQQQVAKEPSDLLILYENRQIANQVAGFGFDAARAAADFLARQPSSGAQGEGEPDSGQARVQLLAKLDAQASSVQSELNAERHRPGTATKKAKALSQAKIAELQGELDLISTKRSIVASMAGFESDGAATNSKAATLRAQIDAMSVALPSASAASPAGAGSAAAANARSSAAASTPPAAALVSAEPSRFGLWDLGANVFALSEKGSTVDTIDPRTAALQATFPSSVPPWRRCGSCRPAAMRWRRKRIRPTAQRSTACTINSMPCRISSSRLSALLIPLSKESRAARPVPPQSRQLARCHREPIRETRSRCSVCAWASCW